MSFYIVLLIKSSKFVSSVLIYVKAPGSSIDLLALSILPNILLKSSVNIFVFSFTKYPGLLPNTKAKLEHLVLEIKLTF